MNHVCNRKNGRKYIKIAFFIDSLDPGGAETLVRDMANTLQHTGDDVIIYHFGNPWLEAQCNRLGIRQYCLHHRRWFKKTLLLPFFSLYFSRVLKLHCIQVLHSHLFGAIVGGMLSARLRGINHIGTLHDVYTLKENSLSALYVRLALLLGVKVVTVSRDMQGLYVRECNIPGKTINVIYNGVKTNQLNLKDSVFPKGADNVFTFICVARFVELKRHEMLVEAFSRLNNKNCQLVLLGDGPTFRGTRDLVSELKISTRVVMPGQVDNVRDWLQSSDCYVLVSDTEGLSCSILEAMETGLPIIATGVGGNVELVTSGENGLLLEKGAIEQLIDVMSTMHKNKERCIQMGSVSRKLVKKNYSYEKMINQYRELYEHTS